MAEFSIELASRAVPLFSGNHIELDGFLVTAELINKSLKNEAKPDFFQYIYHAKLSSNVRTAIGSYARPEDFSSLKSLLEQRYKCTKTIHELQTRLNATFQGKLSVNQYREKITNIIDNLNKLGIEELGNEATEVEKNVIKKLNNKLALESFKKGINDNLKTAVFASRPKSLQDAVELAVDLENEQRSNGNTVMHIRNRQTDDYNRPNRGTYHNFNGQTDNYNRPNRGTYHNFNHNRNFSNGRNYIGTRHANFNRNNNNPPNRTDYNDNNNRYDNQRLYNRNPPNRTDYNDNNNRYNNQRLYNRNQPNRNNNNRRHVHTIQNQGNMMGSECMSIPDGHN